VHDVSCDWEAGARMSERFSQFGLCLVRRGMFIRRTPHAQLFVDSTSAVFEQPGFEQEIIHPRRDGGETTVVLLSDEAMLRYAGELAAPDVLIPIEPAVNLLHHALLADIRRGIDAAELEARLTDLIGLVVERAAPGRLTGRRPRTLAAHRRIVDHARSAIAADPASLDLEAMAAELRCSPFHVSRVFRRATGMTLTQHRNRVRAAAAIDRIADGEERLADLAADLGFADQSHLVRALRRATGMAPSALRRRLEGVNRSTTSKPDGAALSYG
jgi:AraC-like DNA-binding protein